jgi:ubiquitin-protein ligase
MASPDRSQRIRDDLETLRRLEHSSTIFSFQAVGEPPDRLTLRYRGNGVRRDSSPSAKAELVREHEIELRLPYSYPQVPPDIRWITPLYHPNVSFSGFVNLTDVGLEWSPDMGLDLLCERLWDVIRLAQFNNDRAVNYSAKKWVQEQTGMALPVDVRPLHDRLAATNRNVVKYRRRGEPATAESDDDVLYIDENSPAVPLPPAARGGLGFHRGDDDVLYIE